MLIFQLEKTLVKASREAKDDAAAQRYDAPVERRQQAINRYLWDEKQGWCADYNWQNARVRSQLTADAVEGLNHYGKPELAREIAMRFLQNVQAIGNKQQKLVEKYVVEGENLGGGGGGEYPPYLILIKISKRYAFSSILLQNFTSARH